MVKKTYIIILLLVSTVYLNGQNTFISGNARGAEGLKIKIKTNADYISELSKKIDECIIDENGNFKLKANITETVYAQIQIGFLNSDFYLEPGKTYKINISHQNYKEDDKESPFLSKKRLNIELINNDNNELNTLINKFNVIYNDFIIKNFNALYQRRDKSRIDTLQNKINIEFGKIKNNYFNNYIKYRLAGLEQMGRLKNNKKLYTNYLYNQPVLYNHVEYMYFFNEFYEKFFYNGNHSIKTEDLKRYINTERSYLSLLDSLGRDSLVKNEVIREMVFLKGMKELYYSKIYNNDNIIDIISRFASKTKFPEHKKIAFNLIESLVALKPGSSAPDFKLQDLKGITYNLSSFTGKYTYICFFTTWCAGCMPENDAIVDLKKKYNDKVNFVNIAADKQALNLMYYVEKNKYDWYFLYSENNTDIFENYKVNSFPVYILINPQGNIVNYPAMKPSEGIDIIFNKLFKKDIPISNDNQ